MPHDAELRSYLSKLDRAREAYQSDHPNWRLQCLYWILQRGLAGLRQLLEASPERMSWQFPFVELRFPVECRWEVTPDGLPFVPVTGQIPLAHLSNEELMVSTLTQIMVCQLEMQTLQELTNFAGYVRQGDSYRRLLAVEDVERLEAITSESEREKQASALLQPCSFGAATIELPTEMQDGDPIPEDIASQLSRMKPPLVMIPTPFGVESGEVAVIFEIHPMVADVNAKQAYFPLTVGLTAFFERDASLKNPAPGYLKFGNWSSEAKQQLWSSLTAAITALIAELGPVAPAEVETAALTFNAEIQIRPKPNETLDELRRRTLNQFQDMGTVFSFDSYPSGETGRHHKLSRSPSATKQGPPSDKPGESGKSPIDNILEWPLKNPVVAWVAAIAIGLLAVLTNINGIIEESHKLNESIFHAAGGRTEDQKKNDKFCFALGELVAWQSFFDSGLGPSLQIPDDVKASARQHSSELRTDIEELSLHVDPSGFDFVAPTFQGRNCAVEDSPAGQFLLEQVGIKFGEDAKRGFALGYTTRRTWCFARCDVYRSTGRGWVSNASDAFDRLNKQASDYGAQPVNAPGLKQAHDTVINFELMDSITRLNANIQTLWE
jgi:hypothetical protein